MSLRSETVAARALSLSRLPRTCAFLPRGHMIVNDQDLGALVGDVSDGALTNVEIYGAIRVCDWIFTAEQSTLTKDAPFFFGGLLIPKEKGAVATHALFRQAELKDDETVQDALLRFVATEMWPILHPESFADAKGPGDVPVSWMICPLKQKEEK